EGEPEIWAPRIEQALSIGRSAGAGIGMSLSRIGELPGAVVPWEVRLRRLINKALARHPRVSHRRPSRAWLARDAWSRHAGGPQPVFEPSVVRSEECPRLVVCIDTSSSITDVTLRLFASETLSLVRRTRSEAHLLAFDTEVHFRARLENIELLNSLEFQRGGGTDFRAVLEEANLLKPSVIVVFTDLEAELGPTPSADLIWVVDEPPDCRPEFGEVLAINFKSGSDGN
ncbi:MAG: VWA-like domain-containing protein, partial [Pseudomonadota bacterium]